MEELIAQPQRTPGPRQIEFRPAGQAKFVICDYTIEHYIKDHKRALKSDRTSCHRFLANQFRLLLHSAAYVLLWALRAEVLGRGSWSHVRSRTLQLRLLKLGASAKEEADHIRVSLPNSCPVQAVLRRSFTLLRALPGP